MSGDDLNITPEHVKNAGGQLHTLSGEARTKVATFFDSAIAAQNANPGFAAGAAATQYADHLHSSIDSVIGKLEANARAIIEIASGFEKADANNTAGFNREMAALNGLTKPLAPGR